ncbi:hypothetical protein NP233_g11671 [Leucocoprinus birnbaumii]|uniref:Uncharacterized protein n=1 Tax=Leucocoprinus birnbaumii TaxID=56174 RepID=A0AAD5VH20_9AGAR|nr:hypothetical protein NP233_g11671 [Leucocoprinus birnbaumii]
MPLEFVPELELRPGCTQCLLAPTLAGVIRLLSELHVFRATVALGWREAGACIPIPRTMTSLVAACEHLQAAQITKDCQDHFCLPQEMHSSPQPASTQHGFLHLSARSCGRRVLALISLCASQNACQREPPPPNTVPRIQRRPPVLAFPLASLDGLLTHPARPTRLSASNARATFTSKLHLLTAPDINIEVASDSCGEQHHRRRWCYLTGTPEGRLLLDCTDTMCPPTIDWWTSIIFCTTTCSLLLALAMAATVPEEPRSGLCPPPKASSIAEEHKANSYHFHPSILAHRFTVYLPIVSRVSLHMSPRASPAVLHRPSPVLGPDTSSTYLHPSDRIASAATLKDCGPDLEETWIDGDTITTPCINLSSKQASPTLAYPRVPNNAQSFFNSDMVALLDSADDGDTYPTHRYPQPPNSSLTSVSLTSSTMSSQPRSSITLPSQELVLSENWLKNLIWFPFPESW